MFIPRMIPALFLASFVLAACSSDSAPASQGGLQIVASTSILADITQNVAGQNVVVTPLLPVGVDPHAYEAIPADVVKISESNVLVLNGLEYEQFIEPLLESADGERLVIVASDGLAPRVVEDAGKKTEGEQEHAAGDPHMWLDPLLAVQYVENIRDGLVQADPDGAVGYQENAEAYVAQLHDLDAWIEEQISQVPVERRLLVTNHEALGYFADRYGFRIVGSVIPSLSSGAATSAQSMAAVIEQIRESKAPAIFLGEVENAALAEQIAAETGVAVVDNLYLEALTAGPPAATYIDLMKYNVSKIVEALK